MIIIVVVIVHEFVIIVVVVVMHIQVNLGQTYLQEPKKHASKNYL
jgi:type IV secretory pathway VirB3-like protein